MPETGINSEAPEGCKSEEDEKTAPRFHSAPGHVFFLVNLTEADEICL